MGGDGVLKMKKFIKAMKNGNWDDAVYELVDSLWCMQTKSRCVRNKEQIYCCKDKESGYEEKNTKSPWSWPLILNAHEVDKELYYNYLRSIY